MKLTREALNRALLARQGLLEPIPGGLPEVVERIGAIQAQHWPAVPAALFARTRGHSLADVYQAFEDRDLVVGISIRGTVHAVSAREHPVYSAVAESTGADVVRAKAGDPGLTAMRDAVLEFCAPEPRTAEEIVAFAKDWVAAHPGELDPENLAYHEDHGWRPVYRSNSLIRFPDRPDRWPVGTGPKNYLSVPRSAVDPTEARRALLRRHLSAFGPATAEDAATWLGLKVSGVRELVKREPDLVAHTDEAGRPLLDVPDGALPDAATPAPPRLLPKFDSPLLAYGAKHRQRLVADEHKSLVYLKALQVAATFTVDGFVAGTWSLEAKKKVATVTLTPFGSVAKPSRAALTEEAERVLRLMAPDSAAYSVELLG
jgi:hypothetical protein